MGVTWIGTGRFAPSSSAPVAISLTDDFNDASKSAAWAGTTAAPSTYGIGGYSLAGSAIEASNVLTLSGFSASTAQFNGYSSASTVTMGTGQSIWVKAACTGNIGAILALQTGPSFFCQVLIDNLNGLISANNNNSGTGTSFWGAGGTVSYSATDHAWVRLTNTGTQFEVHTAPDSSGTPGTWTLRGTSSAGYASPSAVTVGIWAVANNATPGSVVFDGFCTNA